MARNNKISLGLSPNGYAILAIVLGVVLFLSMNVFANIGFRAARIDLTEQNLFTLSEGTLETLAELEEPITLRFYISQSLIADAPVLQTYGARVRSLLGEYVAHARGNLILEVIDPEPFTATEDEAAAAGLARAQVGPNQIFFGLVGTNTIDGREVIPFFVPSREEFLEYDLTQMVSRLNQTRRPILGITTNLTLDTGPVDMIAIEQGVPARPYFVYEQMAQAFQIEFLEQDFDEVPDRIDVLMVAHPRALDDRTQYAIDQFVMRGGRALVFVDPYSEVSMLPGADGQPMRGATEVSGLPRLLEAWGLQMEEERLVADRAAGTLVPANFDPRRGDITYVAWLSLGPEQFNGNELVTEPLQRGINLGTAGHLTPTPDATTEFVPLISSTPDSMLIDVDEVRFSPDMDRLLREFAPTPESYVMAARVSGGAQSAFPEGQPPEPLREEGEAPGQPDLTNHIQNSLGDINVIVVADSDIFDDAIYVAQANVAGTPQRVSLQDNDTFILNSIDYLMGSNSILSLRARAVSDRPFEVVDNLRRRAEAQFLEEEAALRQQLEEVDQRLRELRGQIRGLGEDAAPELNLRRQQELAEFRQVQIETRQRLREVQRSLRADIENLGIMIKAINIALIPFLIALIAIGLVILHRVRRAERLRARGRA